MAHQKGGFMANHIWLFELGGSRILQQLINVGNMTVSCSTKNVIFLWMAMMIYCVCGAFQDREDHSTRDAFSQDVEIELTIDHDIIIIMILNHKYMRDYLP
eukprot:142108_1